MNLSQEEFRAYVEEQRERDAKLVRKVDKINGTVAKLNAEIGYGLPEPDERQGRLSLRDRMDARESADNVAKAIHDSYARSFGRWQKIFLFVFASLAAVEGFLRLVGVGG